MNDIDRFFYDVKQHLEFFAVVEVSLKLTAQELANGLRYEGKS